MKKVVLIGIASTALVIILAGLFMLATRSRSSTPPADLAVAFVGFTNISDGGYGAMFFFTNGTELIQQLQVTRLESKAEDGWHSQALGKTLFLPLGPGYGFNDWFPVPSTNIEWRIRVACVEEATGVKGLVDTAKKRAFKVLHGREAIFISGRSYQLLSSSPSNELRPRFHFIHDKKHSIPN